MVDEKIAVLIQEGIEQEEIVQFISKATGLPEDTVRDRIERCLSKWREFGFNYKIFEKRFEEERDYFLKAYRTRNAEELADIFAEMAVMLERALVLTEYYSRKLRSLQGK